MKIRVVVTGRSYHLAEALPNEIELPEGATVEEAVGVLAARMNGENALPPSCLVALSGRHLGSLARYDSPPLREGDELLLLSPVAGG